MKRSIILSRLFAALAVLLLPLSALAHITPWIAINNDGGTTTNTITDVGDSTVFGGAAGYQVLAAFPDITLADGQYIQLNATFQMFGRTNSAATGLQQLRDQIRAGLFRAPSGDDLSMKKAEGLTGYIIEHRNEMREIRTPVAAPATGQSPFVSGRSSLITADPNGNTGSYSTASPPGVSGGNPDSTEFTEEDLVTGVDVTMTFQYRIARDGANLDITGSIAGTPVSPPSAPATPPSDSDGVFLEQFSAQNWNPMIDLSGAGSDNFDFLFNRVGFLMGGNVGLDLPTAPATSFPGDYNDDKIVDTADYVVWRDNNNTAATLPNDATPGVDDTDYPIWAANFGRKFGTIVLTDVVVTNGMVGLGSIASTPEPGSLAMMILSALASGWLRRKR